MIAQISDSKRSSCDYNRHRNFVRGNMITEPGKIGPDIVILPEPG